MTPQAASVDREHSEHWTDDGVAVNKHEWREHTDDGELRKIRALHHAGQWRLQQRLAADPGWTDLDPPAREDLLALRDVLWGKYKRGRLPHDQIEEVDALLVAGGHPGDSNNPKAPARGKSGRGRGRRRR